MPPRHGLAGGAPALLEPLRTCMGSLHNLHFAAMFDTIRAELTSAADKVTHLRRFL